MQGCSGQQLMARRANPGAQAVFEISHIDGALVHLHEDGRYRGLVCDREFADSTRAFGPIVSRLVLPLPVGVLAASEQTILIQPFRKLGGKVKAFCRNSRVLDSGQASGSRTHEAVVVESLP